MTFVCPRNKKMSIIIEKVILSAREAFNHNITRNVNFRIDQLQKLLKCFYENEEEFVVALKNDLNKPRFETIIMEIEMLKSDIQYHLDHMHEYVKPEYVKKDLANLWDECCIKYDPLGVVLILGCWNYPIYLLLCPLVGAISAGNCAVIKPSEVASNTEKLMAKLLPRYLNQTCYPVLTGGPDVVNKILLERFDLIFFTGSTTVGRLVCQAAAKHLTPVVLELGGKSPVYIDDSVLENQLETTVKRILWGKTINAGQTCIAPDYLMCTPDVQEKFVQISRKVLKLFYNKKYPKDSKDFARIINLRNFDRINGLLGNSRGNVALGGETDRNTCYIAPTVVTNVSPSDSLMSEELFGPILPIVTVQSAEEAIEFVNRGEKPLSLYLFTNRKEIVQQFLEQTSSGTVCVNDTILQMGVPELPFGGVGHSGIGRYQGRFSFETFSHAKSVLVRTFNPFLEQLASVRYPPYTEDNLNRFRKMVGKTPFDNLKDYTQVFLHLFAFVVGFGAMYAISLI